MATMTIDLLSHPAGSLTAASPQPQPTPKPPAPIQALPANMKPEGAKIAGVKEIPMGTTMTHKEFRHWRKSLKLSQKQAAEALGLKRRVVQYYEKGERDGEKVEIPKAVRLACFALTQGIGDYRGPTRPTTPFEPVSDKEDKKDDKKGHTPALTEIVAPVQPTVQDVPPEPAPPTSPIPPKAKRA